jgi:hypothetical protein
MRIGFMLGRGMASTGIAEALGDGTHPATVRALAKQADLLPDVPRQVVVPIAMAYWQRDALAAKAAELGIEADVLALRIIESAVVLEDLYAAVTDGRYDNDNAGYRKVGGASGHRDHISHPIEQDGTERGASIPAAAAAGRQ